MKKYLFLLLLPSLFAMDYAKDDAEHQMTKSLVSEQKKEMQDLELVKKQEESPIRKLMCQLLTDLSGFNRNGFANEIYGKPWPLAVLNINDNLLIDYEWGEEVKNFNFIDSFIYAYWRDIKKSPLLKLYQQHQAVICPFGALHSEDYLNNKKLITIQRKILHHVICGGHAVPANSELKEAGF